MLVHKNRIVFFLLRTFVESISKKVNGKMCKKNKITVLKWKKAVSYAREMKQKVNLKL